MKKSGVIKESRSPYAFPIVVVRKKNGSVQMCIDYRTLNRRIIPDQYNTLHRRCFAVSVWSQMVQCFGSEEWILPMIPDDQEKTAFISSLGFFEFDHMPQGLMGAPATFQRFMENTVGDMNLIEVLRVLG